MRAFVTILFLLLALALSSQKRTYNIELFGKNIGRTVVERIDKGGGVVEYKLYSHSETSILFAKKTSTVEYLVVYKNGKLFSSYCKNIRDDETEITNILWEGNHYHIRRNDEEWNQESVVDYSAMLMYYQEPKGRKSFYSERLARNVPFVKVTGGEYEYKVENGVLNIYKYRNGVLYESQISKGASVFMRLVQ